MKLVNDFDPSAFIEVVFLKRPAGKWDRELLNTGTLFLSEMNQFVDQADPRTLVKERPKFLCAALGLLSQISYDALGGQSRRHEVGRAGALLSLLTKIDDQVIDSPDFHGGCALSFEEAQQKTRDYLAPTLESIKTGKPANTEARCLLAAMLGGEIRALSGESKTRFNQVIEWIEFGWSVQSRAVATLSRHSADISQDSVNQVTRDISGAWLLMIAAIGSLPSDAHRMFTASEVDAFFQFGWHIQRADALADMAKDLADGLISSYPDRLLYSLNPVKYENCLSLKLAEPIYAICREMGIDILCLPSPEELISSEQEMAQLGDLPDLLNWIHGFLTWRYLIHPFSQRSIEDKAFQPFMSRKKDYINYLQDGPQEFPKSHTRSLVLGS